MNTHRLFLIILTAALPSLLFAAGSSEHRILILEYYDDPAELSIRTAEGKPAEEISKGMELREGAVIRTGETTAELRIRPSGAIVKIGRDTDFSTDTLAGGAAERTVFSVAKGMIRTITGRLGKDALFRIDTPSASNGVRGTDFGVRVDPGVSEIVFVLRGRVRMRRPDGSSITLTAGTAADALVQPLRSVDIKETDVGDELEELRFRELDPEEVPGSEEDAEDSDEDGESEETESVETGTGGESDTGDTDGGGSGDSDAGDTDTSDSNGGNEED